MRATGAAGSPEGNTLGELDWFWAGLRPGPDDGCSSCRKALLKTVEKCRGDEAAGEAAVFSALAGDVGLLEFEADEICEGAMLGSEAVGPDKRFTPPASAG